MEFVPEPAPLRTQSSTAASHAEVLTGKSSANKVNCGEAVGAPWSVIGSIAIASTLFTCNAPARSGLRTA